MNGILKDKNKELYVNNSDILISDTIKNNMKEFFVSGKPISFYIKKIKIFIDSCGIRDLKISEPKKNESTGDSNIELFVSSLCIHKISYIVFKRTYIGRGEMLIFRGPICCKNGVPDEFYDVVHEYNSIPTNQITDIQLYLKIDSFDKVIMIDDINDKQLKKMYSYGFCPNAVVKTSNNNHQLWFVFDRNIEREGTLKNLKDYICFLISIWFHGDILFKNSDPGGYGRIPEVYNTKRKYMDENGEFIKSELVYVSESKTRCPMIEKMIDFFLEEAILFEKYFDSSLKDRILLIRENSIDIDIFNVEHDL